jgi:hypothetical protein
VDVGVEAVLLDRMSERSVLTAVVTADLAEGVDDFAELVDVDGVAVGESPPSVEGVEALLEVWDPVDGVPVEQLAQLVLAPGLAQLVQLAVGVVVAVDVGADRGSNLLEVLVGPGDLVLGAVELSAGSASAADPAALKPIFC